MRQLTLGQAFSQPGLQDPRPLEVFDLFAGAGGFSCGARAAGCKIKLAVDEDEQALRTFAENFPEAKTLAQRLPCDDALPFPSDGRPWHLHGSPPCQKFRCARGSLDRATPLQLVEWFLDLALGCGCTSWTFEQVPSKQVLAVFSHARRQHPDRVAFAVVKFWELGVPQSRRRLVGGSPHLVARLLRAREEQPRRSVRDVVPRPRGDTLLNSKQWFKRERKRRQPTSATSLPKRPRKRGELAGGSYAISGLAPTVLQSQLHWVRGGDAGAAPVALTAREYAHLQCFPRTFRLPKKQSLARAQVAHAVPPRVAELLMGGLPATDRG